MSSVVRKGGCCGHVREVPGSWQWVPRSCGLQCAGGGPCGGDFFFWGRRNARADNVSASQTAFPHRSVCTLWNLCRVRPLRSHGQRGRNVDHFGMLGQLLLGVWATHRPCAAPGSALGVGAFANPAAGPPRQHHPRGGKLGRRLGRSQHSGPVSGPDWESRQTHAASRAPSTGEPVAPAGPGVLTVEVHGPFDPPSLYTSQWCVEDSSTKERDYKGTKTSIIFIVSSYSATNHRVETTP